MGGTCLASFTLAEVLIVLGIIGLIADMTIPTLVQGFQEKVTVVKLQEIYSIFNQALKMSVAESGPMDTWGFKDIITVPVEDGNFSYDNEQNQESSKILYEVISKHLKILKTCKPEDTSCMTIKEATGFPMYSGILANGVSFYVFSRSASCKYNTGTTMALQNICADLTVDIDGNKGSNTWGKDIFRFSMSNYGIIPRGTAEETHHIFEDCRVKLKDKNVSVLDGETCTAWVVYNGNMDYLRCNNLSWSGAKTCK